MSSSTGSIASTVGKISAAVVAAAALAAGALALPGVTGGGGGGGNVANCWVNTTAGASPQRLGSAGAYDSTKAYGSVDAAQDACTTAGDVVGVNQSSSYGTQTITGTRTNLVTVNANGSTFSGISVSANKITINDFTVSGNSVSSSGDDVTWNNADLHGLETNLDVGGTNFTWDGGEFGFSGWNPADRNFCTGSVEPVVINGAVNPHFRNIDFWHVERLDDPTNQCDHLEYLRPDGGGSGLWLDSVFFHDDGGLEESNSSTIFISNPSNGATYSGLKITNSYFGDNAAPGVIGINENVDNCTNWTIAYNTWRQIPFVPSTVGGGACGTNTGTVWVGNLGPNSGFHACAGTHIKNRWQFGTAGTCGTDQWTIGPDYGVGNLGFSTTTGRLTSGSVALDGAETTYCASAISNLDAFGRARTGTCDNGMAEGVG